MTDLDWNVTPENKWELGPGMPNHFRTPVINQRMISNQRKVYHTTNPNPQFGYNFDVYAPKRAHIFDPETGETSDNWMWERNRQGELWAAFCRRDIGSAF